MAFAFVTSKHLANDPPLQRVVGSEGEPEEGFRGAKPAIRQDVLVVP